MTTDPQLAPPRWRVEHRATGWQIVSPQGTELWRAPTQRAGVEVATMFAGVDELLARVARLERNAFGNHPALRAPARRPYGFGRVAPRPLALVCAVRDWCCGTPTDGPHSPGCDFEPRAALDLDGPAVVVEP